MFCKRRQLWMLGALSVLALVACREPFGEEAPVASRENPIVVNTGRVIGEMTYSNTNPDVLEAASGILRYCSVQADNSVPEGYSATTDYTTGVTFVTDENGYRVTCEFAMDVPVPSDSASGITYDLTGNRYHSFGTQEITVTDENDADNPLVADFPELCLGAAKVQLRDTETGGCEGGGTPYYEVDPDEGVDARPSFHALDGQTVTRSITISNGGDPYVDYLRRTFSFTWTGECDVLEEICVDMTPIDDSELGALTGPLEVEGEELLHTAYVYAYSGPDSNYRYYRDNTPPLEDPWWVLPNMLPGDYNRLTAYGFFREDEAMSYFHTTKYMTMTVVADETTEVVCDDDTYPLQMSPGSYYGTIHMYNPTLTAGMTGSFDDLVLATDLYAGTTYPQNGTCIYASGGSSDSSTAFAIDSFDPDNPSDGITSDYEMLMPAACDETFNWNSHMRLVFSSGTVEEPSDYRNGSLRVAMSNGNQSVPADTSVNVDYEFCMGEAVIRFETAEPGTLLFDPWVAQVSGTHEDYSVYQYSNDRFHGTPIVQDDASATASLSFPLIQAEYHLDTPSIRVLSEDNTVTNAYYPNFDFECLCGCDIVLTPGLSVTIGEVNPTCALDPNTPLPIQVNADGNEPNRVWYTVNGGEEVELCSGECNGSAVEGCCGTDPSFELEIMADDLQECDNELVVKASAAHTVGTAEAKIVVVKNEGDGCDTLECTPIEDSGYECVHGASRVDIRDRTSVNSNVSGGYVELGRSAQVNGDIASSGNVYLRNNSLANGDVTATGNIDTQLGAQVVGTAVTGASVTLDPIPTQTFSVGSETVQVGNGEETSLSPGEYGDATLYQGSALTLLGPGTFNFNSLTLYNAVVNISGADVEINIQSKFEMHQGSEFNPSTAENVTIYTNAEQVYLYDEILVNAVITAPEADITVGRDVTFGGCIAGDTLTIGPDTFDFTTGTVESLCGNDVLDDGEECDDGNMLNSDNCLDNCTLATCSDGFLHIGSESDVDCGGAECAPCADGRNCNENSDCESDDCVDGTCRSIVLSTVCDGICSNPVRLGIGGSGDLGASEHCYVVESVVSGGNCGNFDEGRVLSVNGQEMACAWQNWSSIPDAVDGGYCIFVSAGTPDWAAFNIW